MPDITEAQSIAELATNQIAPQRHDIDGVPVLILKDGSTRSLEYLQSHPRRKRATAVFSDPKAFIAYLLAHKEPGTLITGDVTETSGDFRAIIDYPHAGEQGTAKWGEHVVALQLKITPEWARWLEHNGKSKTQTDFAEFLEDNAPDVVKPSGAELLEVAMTLQAAKAVNFRSGVRLKDGRNQLTYVEEIDARAGSTGQLEIPERFTIAIAPFVGCERMGIEARLRYRIDAGRLSFAYKLYQPHLVILQAWADARTAIEAETGLMIHRGSASVNNPKG